MTNEIQTGSILSYNKSYNMVIKKELQYTYSEKDAKKFRKNPAELIFAIAWAYRYTQQNNLPMVVRPTNKYNYFLYGIATLDKAWRFPVYYNDTVVFVVDNGKVFEAEIIKK